MRRKGVEGALFRYQVMANIVGCALVILVFVAIPIQVWGHNKIPVEIIGVGHGYLYIVYLVTAGLLAVKARLNIVQIVAMVAAGLVPGLAFLVEWWVAKSIRAKLAVAEAQGAPEAAADR